MCKTSYPTPLVWFGVWKTPYGIKLEGFHVWNRRGNWHGVYKTCTRAGSEAHLVRNLK
jgi:hypothetical protein